LQPSLHGLGFGGADAIAAAGAATASIAISSRPGVLKAAMLEDSQSTPKEGAGKEGVVLLKKSKVEPKSSPRSGTAAGAAAGAGGTHDDLLLPLAA
jgi:hypothetical protein